MELSSQMKKYRSEAGLSQDALAERIYVSRQTVSNWETGKNYPDINSLLRMSEVFGITVDTLLKGDVEEMKTIVREDDQREFVKASRIFSTLLVVMIVTPVPLAMLLKWVGFAIWLCIAAVTLLAAYIVEKKKKSLNIQTYREIVAYLDGERLTPTEAAVEEGKRPYQKALLAIGCGLVALGVAIIFIAILQ
ncbi:MAG: helix-turn-helix domain-containing protein [Lachnospiraceae bacterium]|nr:helix-turn-helix domain-containing protein [Lachnospiraceae bacterium]